MTEQKFSSDVEAIDALAAAYKKLAAEIGKVIVGQDDVVRAVIISLFSNGHSLLIGVPGLAKTLLVSTIARALDLDFKRVQFTPDLMPSDITGSEILGANREFTFSRGPIFANIVLADEINRTPPKTHFLCLQHKIRLSKKELIRYPKHNSTVLCSTSCSIIRVMPKSCAS